jgi:4-amino-4-deoxy-L-arabinose transferase-like glycosyltransferase
MSRKKKRITQSPAPSAKTVRKPTPARDWWWLAVFAAAFAVRLIFVWHSRRLPFFFSPIIDAQGYDSQAAELITTGISGRPFDQAPLYTVFLAANYYIFGQGYLAPRIVQCLMGAASCVMVQRLGARLSGRTAGVIAGFAAALYGPLVFYETDLLREVLVVFLALALLLCLLRWEEDARLPWAAAAGFLMGLSLITRENTLLFLPVAAAWLFFRAENRSKNRWLAPALFVLLAMLTVLPVTMWNYLNSGALVPISSESGVNFFIGNSADSDRLTGLQPGIAWDRMRKAPQAELGENPSPTAYNAWFFRRAFRDIAAAPGAWVEKLIKKAWLVFDAEEIEPNNDINLYRGESWLLRTLIFRLGPLWFPFGLVAPFFVLGAVTRKPSAGAWLNFAFISAYATSLVLFHVRARYRLPIVPVMLPFAAAGALWVAKQWKVRNAKAVAAGLLGLLAVAVLVNTPIADVSFAHRFPTHYMLGKSWLIAEQDVNAVQEFERALNAHEDFAELRHDYGQSLVRLGREDEGLPQIERAVALAPDCVFCRKDLGQLYRRKGERLQARARELFQKDPASAEGMADVRESWRLLRGAVKEFETAEELDPFDVTIVHDLAFLHEEAGDEAAFRQKLEEFIKRARNKPELAEWVQRAEQILRDKGGPPRGTDNRN